MICKFGLTLTVALGTRSKFLDNCLASVRCAKRFTWTLPSKTPLPEEALTMHLCTWLLVPSSKSNCNLLCKSKVCPAPARLKHPSTVSVRGPSCLMLKSCRAVLPPTEISFTSYLDSSACVTSVVRVCTALRPWFCTMECLSDAPFSRTISHTPFCQYADSPWPAKSSTTVNSAFSSTTIVIRGADTRMTSPSFAPVDKVAT